MSKIKTIVVFTEIKAPKPDSPWIQSYEFGEFGQGTKFPTAAEFIREVRKMQLHGFELKITNVVIG